MASPNLSEIITTTLRNRSGKVADNVSKGNALLMKLKEKGSWKSATGRTIVQELDYQENGTFAYYSGGETLSIAASDVITAAEWNWKQCYAAVTATGLETDVQNTGKEQVIDLLESRITNAERTMRNNICASLYSAGTNSKEIEGLQLLVADDPTTSTTIGGINQSTWSFWQNKVYDCSTDGGSNPSATNIQKFMNALYLKTSRGSEHTDLIMMDGVYYALFWASLQAIQRIADSNMANAGFQTVKFAGADVVYEDSTGMPASHAYFLMTDYLFFRYSPRRNFTPLERVQSINQDAIAQLITFAGNLTTSNRSRQGVLKT